MRSDHDIVAARRRGEERAQADLDDGFAHLEAEVAALGEDPGWKRVDQFNGRGTRIEPRGDIARAQLARWRAARTAS